jgi:hypothetical protein
MTVVLPGSVGDALRTAVICTSRVQVLSEAVWERSCCVFDLLTRDRIFRPPSLV